MNKYEPAFTYNGVALQGWQSAALLAEAVKAAGNNLTQANVINITNHITNFTAGGLSTVTNWDDGPHQDHLSDLQRLRPGAGQEVRAGLRQGQAGLRLRRARTPRTRCRYRRRPAPRGHDPARSRARVGAGTGVEHFLGFAIPGIPFGCTYAMVAVGLVLTYQATGVFNFAFGAQAYISAFVFTLLVQNEHMPVWLAFVLSVVLLAPALGLAFDRYLFRKIPNSNTTAKLVTGITLFVGIPALLPVIFGSNNQYNPPSILFNPDTVYFRIGRHPDQRDLR